jgi:hypothetical protein
MEERHNTGVLERRPVSLTNRTLGEADNRYLEKAAASGMDFDAMTPDELITRRLQAVLKTREQYRRFWEENVATKPKE